MDGIEIEEEFHSSADEKNKTYCEVLGEENLLLKKQINDMTSHSNNLHGSAEKSSEGFLSFGGLSWIILLIVFLLGMITEYIIASLILLLRRK